MPSDNVSSFEFDLSKMTIGDTVTIMRLFTGMREPADFRHQVAMLEMLDRVTVGGIMHLPADVSELLIRDFTDHYIKVFGKGENDGS